MLKLDIGITNFTKEKIEKNIIEKAVFNTLKLLKFNKSTELSVVLVGERRMRSLNRDFRKKDKVTDVLSFAFSENSFEENNKGFLNSLGEIVICVAAAKRQAGKKKLSFKRELALLSSHGTIHLLGIDHERSATEEEETEKVQKKALDKMFDE